MIVTRGIGRNQTGHINSVVGGMGRFLLDSVPDVGGPVFQGNWYFKNRHKFARRYTPSMLYPALPDVFKKPLQPIAPYEVPKFLEVRSVSNDNEFGQIISTRTNVAVVHDLFNDSYFGEILSKRGGVGFAHSVVNLSMIERASGEQDYTNLATTLLLLAEKEDEEDKWQ